PRSPRSPTPAPQLPDPAAADAWLDTEQANLLAAATHATVLRPAHTTHQSATLHRHLDVRGYYTEAHTLHQHALTAARATGEPAAHPTALNSLGWIHYRQGRYGPAADCHTQALQAAQASGNRAGELNALTGLGRVHHVQGRHGPATDCHTRALRMAWTIG